MGVVDGSSIATTAMAAAPRVVIVDDDEWIRRGRADGLRETDAIRSVVAIDHADALADPSVFDDCDVAVVDAHVPSERWDRFVGVQVVREIRARRDRQETRIVVVTGHANNDALRQRFADAGADYLYSHDDVRSVPDLVEAITTNGPALARTRSGPKWDDAIQLVEEAQATELFVPGVAIKQSGISRRRTITLRTKLVRLLGLSKDTATRDVVRVVNRARGETMTVDDGA